MAANAEPIPHATAKCCWCGGALWLIGAHYWCKTDDCWRTQAAWGISIQPRAGTARERVAKLEWFHVPAPKQVEFQRVRRPGASDGSAFCVLAGGAAGTAKSTVGRRSMYWRALEIPEYEGLLLRRTYKELEKTHLRKMAREATWLNDRGIKVVFHKTDKLLEFPNGSLIECGHMDSAEDVDKYLSTEYDDIVPDEASTFPNPDDLLELVTRARSSKAAVLAAGGPWFRPLTNPGGPCAAMLKDFFITHTPDFDTYPKLRETYRPDHWVYVPSTLDDNPYIGPGYVDTLALLKAARYEQLRWGNWDVFTGQFFTSWRATMDGRPWHVQELDLRGADVLWVRAIDWGRSLPGCVGWFACLVDGHYHQAAELRFVDMDVADVVIAMRAIDRDLGVDTIRYTVGDPSIGNKVSESGEPIAETFRKCGVPIRLGKNARQSGWERIRNLLRDDGAGVPWLTVSPRCRYLIRTLPALQQDAHNPEDISQAGTAGTDDHAADMLRYFAMSRPSPPRPGEPAGPIPGTLGADLAAVRATLSREANA